MRRLKQFFSRQAAPDEFPLVPQHARDLILQGRAPDGLQVEGRLDLSGCKKLLKLPAGLTATSVDLSGCLALSELPADLRVRRLNLSDCPALTSLPAGFRCYELEWQRGALRELPADLQVEYRINLSGCAQLECLPEGLKTGTLILRDCVSLTGLPEGLEVCFLDISGCLALRAWPRQARVRIGRFRANDCPQLTALPDWLTDISQLDVSGCVSLTVLPDGLRVSSWIDLANTGIKSLPSASRGARLRWRGVPIDERIAFQPETITAQEILQETNLELRRVKLERMGYEAFLRAAQAKVLHRDCDPGGERRLLRVPLEDDEDLVCLAVFCPSTGRQYVLRVPPTMRTCHQAAAWIAGFDNPDDYRPLVET